MNKKIEPVKWQNSIKVGPKRDRKLMSKSKRKSVQMDQRELKNKNWKDKNVGEWLDSTLAA
jgi:hypothetical protein